MHMPRNRIYRGEREKRRETEIMKNACIHYRGGDEMIGETRDVFMTFSYI